MLMRLDRSSPVPLYYQAAQELERAIADGEFPPGFKLDNEIRLADHFGLSRPTMRRAIQGLVDKGLLVRRRGIGTQVVQGEVTRSVKLSSLYEDLAQEGRAPSTTVLLREIIPAGEQVADAPDLNADGPMLHIRRLRCADGEPLAILDNYLPEYLCQITAADLERRGLYQLMRGRGVHIRVAKQRIGARRGTDEECTLLTERRRSSLLTMTRTTFDDSGQIVESGQHVYRTGRYSFEVTLVEH